MPTDRPLPKIVNQSSEEFEKLLEDIKHSSLSEDQQSTVIGCIEFSRWLPSMLEEKNITIANLRRALFGDSKKAGKKNKDDDGKETSAEDEATLSNADENNDELEAIDEASEDTAKNTAALVDQEQETDESKKPPNGHGRLGYADYPNAIDHVIEIDGLKVGDDCPSSCGGRLYALNPGNVLRIVGNSLATAHHYQLSRLRCALCGLVVKASLPDGVHPRDKYDHRFKAILSVEKYYVGTPYYRQSDCQGMLGLPLPASTQFELCESVADCAYPVLGALENLGANGKLAHIDDTNVKILSVILDNKNNPEKKRTGMFTTGMIIKTHSGQKIALFYSGTRHAGENFKALLTNRTEESYTMRQMCDALSRNMPSGLKVILSNCLSHGFRKFRDLLDYYPTPCLHVMKALGKIYRFDEETKGMTDMERLQYHRQYSKPIMLALNAWLKKQLREKQVEPNSALGEAMRYMLKHWKKLRRFLTTPGAPIDNNIVEAALKIPIRVRKTAMFYKTEHGASIANILTSLIYTAKLAGENPVDYLVALQDNKSAVFADPAAWVPWCYRETLGALAYAKAA